MDNGNGKRTNKPHSGRKLAERLALEVMAECRFDRDTIIDMEFYTLGFAACRRKVGKLRVESQALLLASGASYRDQERHRTALYEVHGGTWINKYDSGREILRQGAATAVMAKVVDFVQASPTRLLIQRLEATRAET